MSASFCCLMMSSEVIIRFQTSEILRTELLGTPSALQSNNHHQLAANKSRKRQESCSSPDCLDVLYFPDSDLVVLSSHAAY